MAFVAVAAIGGGAALGIAGGMLKSGPDANMYGRGEAQKAYDAYKNLVSKGPGQQDVTNSLNATRDFSSVLGNLANTGLYNSSEGSRLAEMQFAPQRQALAQSLQDQMATANRAANAAGRSSNDPILRARLGAEAMRQTAALSSAQSSAAMDLGRQSTMDMLGMRGQQVGMLQSMADQAFNNQNNLFGMGAQIQTMDTGSAQYEASRGGGLKGAITGAITGIGAGMQVATGLNGMTNSTTLANASANASKAWAAQAPTIARNLTSMGANMSAPSQSFAPSQTPSPYFNPAYFANPAANVNPYAGQIASTTPHAGPSSITTLQNYALSGFNPFSYIPSAPNGSMGVPNSFYNK